MGESDRNLLADFIGRCFELEPQARPLPTDMLRHPFLHEPRAEYSWMKRQYPEECPFIGFTSQRKQEMKAAYRKQLWFNDSLPSSLVF